MYGSVSKKLIKKQAEVYGNLSPVVYARPCSDDIFAVSIKKYLKRYEKKNSLKIAVDVCI